jgi:plasmid replication initiation protein
VVEKLDDILTRFGNKVASAGEQDRTGQGAKPRLLANRHPNRDFFVADLLDWAVKDDRASMEHPMFSLSKNPDRRIRRYEHNGLSVTITPSVLGIATIWDKDVLIYAISQLVEGLNRGQPTSRVVRLKAYDLLVATNRHTGGKNYERLVESLRRLKGTQIETNIVTDGRRERRGFGLLEEWRIVEKSPNSDRMVAIELTLSEWLYRAICSREVLTLSSDYFRLDGGLDRRLYELARKHCGRQERWAIGLDLLHKKTGSAASLRKFRQLVKQTAESNLLPEYWLDYQCENDQATFTLR